MHFTRILGYVLRLCHVQLMSHCHQDVLAFGQFSLVLVVLLQFRDRNLESLCLVLAVDARLFHQLAIFDKTTADARSRIHVRLVENIEVVLTILVHVFQKVGDDTLSVRFFNIAHSINTAYEHARHVLSV